MRLERVTIAGYRSIREVFKLDLDPRVTVVLGANDHGKTNLLNGILHLNEDHPFDQENDLNLDYEGRRDEFPAVSYSFRLSDQEREELLRRETGRVQLEAIAAFRAQLDNEAKEARKAAEVAHREDAKAAAALAGLKGKGEEGAEASSEEAPPADPNALARAGADAQEKTSASEVAREAADVAEARARLARSEELRIVAESDGIENFDLAVAADAAEAEAGKAVKTADRLRGQADQARAAATEAVSTQGEGTEEAKKAQRTATTAEQEAKAARQHADRLMSRATDLRSAADASALAESGELAFAKDALPPEPSQPKLPDIPESVAFGRVGLDGELELTEPAELGDEAEAYLRQRLPRVELIEPQERLPDSATSETILDAGNDFMRGIFRYAGLEPEEWEEIFAQTDATRKRVAAANEQLNKTLRDSWSQGKELRFELDHREGEIDLLIDDPAVKQTYVRASRRSAGFTHFFALKTMLYAREQASGASSFIWLFDDPGIYLHPEGQHDLLQVLETLAQANQLVYSTHSIFLINKNFPTRHRLLKKTAKGTIIDHKPYTSQWRSAIEALGLSFPGTFLFASKVLLVEGDSDPILLNADLQKLIEIGELTFDINPLSIISTGDSKHADALIRILLDSAVKPEVALLFDGDKGGLDRRKSLKALVEAKKLPWHQLTKDTSAEDHLLAPALFREATIRYLEGSPDAPEKIREELEASYTEQVGTSAPKGVAKWARSEGKRLLGEDDEPSAVGIAREYARLLADTNADDLPTSVRKRATDLANKIAEMLKLAPRTVEQEQIVEEL